MEGEIDIQPIKEKEEIVAFLCLCPECSSWVECEEKGGFCFETLGKSRCISEEKECICTACPIPGRMGFEFSYYCTRGSAKEQETNLR